METPDSHAGSNVSMVFPIYSLNYRYTGTVRDFTPLMLAFHLDL